MIEELLILAESAQSEDDRVEFKSTFCPEKKSAFWAEIVKDIVAMANTAGGVVIFGKNDDGTNSDDDCLGLIGFDPAKITDQIAKWTGMQFSQFKIMEAIRSDGRLPIIAVLPSRLPIVFTKVGTYEFEPGVQKTAFSVGTLYFRHGAKSEPANQDDVRDAFMRELVRDRREWLANMQVVLNAPPGSTLRISNSDDSVPSVRLSNDPAAPEIKVRNLSETHPYRQSEVLGRVKSKSAAAKKINSHDIQCIKFVEGVTPHSRPDLVHKPHEMASPQYSESFIKLIETKIAANENYLLECRKSFKKSRYGY